MDGLVYPDRRPHTGLLEFKNIYRPARVTHYDQSTGTLTLHNYMDFVDLTDYATLSYELNCDGQVVSAGSVPFPGGFRLRRTRMALCHCRWMYRPRANAL